MTLQELIQRERIAANELRQELSNVTETAIKRQLERLNDLEVRIEKELLTNGKVSIPLTPLESAAEVIGTIGTKMADSPAEEKEKGKKGKPDRE